MTDGGEGHRSHDDPDGFNPERSDEQPPEIEYDSAEQRTDATAGRASELPESGSEESNETEPSIRGTPEVQEPELGEPTPSQIARIRARESSLERDEITAYTTERRSLDPSVQLQWGVWTGIISVVLGTIAGAILGNFGVAPQFGTVVVGLFLLLGVVWVILRYRVWVYQVRADSLYLERGVVTNVRTIVPYVRIQHVDTSRGPLERALGLSTLVVYTAGSRGADVSVPGLQPEEARDLQQRLKELAIEAEGDDAL